MLKHTLTRLLLVFFLIIPFSGSRAQNATDIKNYKGVVTPKDSLDHYLASRMEELEIPGLAIALINDGKVVYHRTLGFADREQQRPVDEQTIFEGASLSKSVFAFFVMKYVEEGKLDLDKPLYQYVPYPDIAYDERYRKITARMVLSHRSGFPNWRENEEDRKLKILFEPGTDYLYSGEGYQYLAMVLKHIEGTDWQGLEAAFQDKIAKPIGLEHTVFIQTPYTREHKAEPYDKNGQWIDWKNNYWYHKNKDTFVAPASIHTEALDFSKWMITVMKQELLAEESYQELLKRHSELPGDEQSFYYCLGFFTADKPYHHVYVHGGSNEGFTCWYMMDIEQDWGYVLFTNSEYGEKLGNELGDYLEKEAY